MVANRGDPLNNIIVSGNLVSGNLIKQAGRYSITVRTGSSTGSRLCIAQFNNNTSRQPNVFGINGSDLSVENTNGSSIDFVDFSTVSENNIGFDDITGLPTNEPTACP